MYEVYLLEDPTYQICWDTMSQFCISQKNWNLFGPILKKKARNGVFMPPPGSWQAPLGNQIDPRVSADAVNVRNDQQQCPRPQAVLG